MEGDGTMTDVQKVERIKALIEEINELSAELSEDELEQVAGGSGPCGCIGPGLGKVDPGTKERYEKTYV
jgi:hypothetical protein